MFCSKCGGEIKPEDTKCPHCGNEVRRSKGKKKPIIIVLVALVLLVCVAVVAYVLVSKHNEKVAYEEAKKAATAKAYEKQEFDVEAVNSAYIEYIEKELETKEISSPLTQDIAAIACAEDYEVGEYEQAEILNRFGIGFKDWETSAENMLALKERLPISVDISLSGDDDAEYDAKGSLSIDSDFGTGVYTNSQEGHLVLSNYYVSEDGTCYAFEDIDGLAYVISTDFENLKKTHTWERGSDYLGIEDLRSVTVNAMPYTPENIEIGGLTIQAELGLTPEHVSRLLEDEWWVYPSFERISPVEPNILLEEKDGLIYDEATGVIVAGFRVSE